MKQGLWECPDETAAEVEMSDLLYALVRMLKPQLVVETGTYKGDSTYAIGRALNANGFGKLVTCDPIIYEDRLSFRHRPEVEYRQCLSLDLPELAEADFIFSDSDYKYRAAEIGRAKRGATILVHDTKISYDSAIPPLEGLVNDIGGLTFDTYRGFGLIRKKI